MPEAMGSRCPLRTGHDFVSHRFGLLRCGTCGLIVNPRIFDAAAADVLNEKLSATRMIPSARLGCVGTPL